MIRFMMDVSVLWLRSKVFVIHIVYVLKVRKIRAKILTTSR